MSALSRRKTQTSGQVLSAPPNARIAKSLGDWFTATESYPRQLREMGRGEYLEMKRKEYARQQG